MPTPCNALHVLASITCVQLSALGLKSTRSLPDNVRPSFITLAQNIEQKEVHIIEEGLVIQEELCQIAQVLAEHLFLLAVNLKHGHFGIPVDLISRWVLNATPLEVLEHLLALFEEG